MRYVSIDPEMRQQAKIEAGRRDQHIKHHFEVAHLSYQERDEVGFLGEFACCKLLGKDWRENIRENYLTIDDFDIVHNGKRIDVKTETVPQAYVQRILSRSISDDGVYGRRLINKNQLPLLAKYDIVVFGLFERNAYDKWYPIGFLETNTIREKYPPQSKRPDGGFYPFSAAAVRTSELKDIKLL
jgi:hypothetical protein